MSANPARLSLIGLSLLTGGAVYAGLPAMPFSCLNFSLLTLGLILRHNRTCHAALMAGGIGGDLGIVVGLQLQKSVIQTAIGEPMSFFGNIHVGSSLAAAVCYPIMLVVGFGLLTGKLRDSWPLRHKIGGIATYLFRTIGFITMFLM